MTDYPLTDDQLGAYFIEDSQVASDADALDLEPLVATWLSIKGLSHRRAFPIAVAANRLAKATPVATPDETWTRANRESYGDATLPSADQINAMSMAEFARARQDLGVAPPTLLEFLGGR
jgi:hypothetical protein